MMDDDMVGIMECPAIIGDQTLTQLAEQAEARVAALDKIKKVALRSTNAHDWVDQSGRPYLQASGSEKVARLFGVSWRIEEPTLENEDGGHYNYTYRGTFSLSGASIEAIGTRSSKDGFFRKYDHSGAEKIELPPSAIDRGDVKKAAYTNLLGNGITRLLGIRNLTYDDLREYAGITKDQVTGIDRKTAGKTTPKATHTASEGAVMATFCPTDVRSRMGTNAKTGKAWTQFLIYDGQAIYTTFSESFREVAEEAQAAGRQVAVAYTTNRYGNAIEAMAFADDGPGPGTGEGG